MALSNIARSYDFDLYSLQNLNLGEHICSIYNDEKDFRTSIVEYIEAGLRLNQKVIYAGPAYLNEKILSYLKMEGIDCAHSMSKGQLRFVTLEEVLEKQDHFSPEKLLNLYKDECIKSEKEGYSALRLSGLGDWVLQRFRNKDEFIEYEHLINSEIANKYKFIGFCQYDLNKFHPEFLNRVIDVHPYCHLGSDVCHNQYYIPPEFYFGPDKESKILHQRMNEIKNRKQREQEIASLYKQTEELREFSYMVAHDIKTPIKNALLMKNVVENDHLCDMPEEAKDVFSRLDTSLVEAYKRVEKLQELAQVSQEKKGFSQINLNKFIEEIISYYKANTQGISCEFVFQPKKELFVWADKIHLNQLFANLIDNSIKYRKPNEPLFITIDIFQIIGQGINITIRDNGIGFSPIHNQRIFRPFNRLNSSATPSGTGLGLTICQRIMVKYYGEITAEGQENVGASFTMRFPEISNPLERRNVLVRG